MPHPLAGLKPTLKVLARLENTSHAVDDEWGD
jgi:hypothetical protein